MAAFSWHMGGCSQALDLQQTFHEMELFGYPKKRIRRLASSCRRYSFVRQALQM